MAFVVEWPEDRVLPLRIVGLLTGSGPRAA